MGTSLCWLSGRAISAKPNHATHKWWEVCGLKISFEQILWFNYLSHFNGWTLWMCLIWVRRSPGQLKAFGQEGHSNFRLTGRCRSKCLLRLQLVEKFLLHMVHKVCWPGFSQTSHAAKLSSLTEGVEASSTMQRVTPGLWYELGLVWRLEKCWNIPSYVQSAVLWQSHISHSGNLV